MTNILIAIVVLLLIATLVQILRVSELLSEIKNTDVNEVTDEDNNTQGVLFLIVGFGFLIFVIWQMVAWDHLLLPPASSVHGTQIDFLMKMSMGLILVAFFILSPMLFYFLYKYRGKKSNKAYFFSHHNKLEVIWTVVPTIILTGFIIFGLKTWDSAMNVEVSESTTIIEVYGKQFNWTARYSGLDNNLGQANYKLVKGRNTLGVDTLDENYADDKVTSEVHLVIDKPVLLKFRSQDVIHSAFLPHFRVQMNCVPGMVTQFGFTPTKTTEEMRKDPKVIKQMKAINSIRLANGEGEVEFEYILLCNKICGSAHYNMQMKFIVETQEEYDVWYASQENLKNKLLTQK